MTELVCVPAEHVVKPLALGRKGCIKIIKAGVTRTIRSQAGCWTLRPPHQVMASRGRSVDEEDLHPDRLMLDGRS
jgi:hypothetical protein